MSSFQVPSLSMLSNPLPQVVKCPLAGAAPPVEEVKVEVVQPEIPQTEKDKIVIILHTKDVSEEDRELLKKHGSLRDMNYSMYNLPLENLQCNYLLVDVTNKLNKLHISRVNTENFKFCAYVHSFQQHDNIFEDFLENINVMTKFPTDYKVAFKSEFDEILTSLKKIKNTSCLVSLLSFLINGLGAVMKK